MDGLNVVVSYYIAIRNVGRVTQTINKSLSINSYNQSSSKKPTLYDTSKYKSESLLTLNVGDLLILIDDDFNEYSLSGQTSILQAKNLRTGKTGQVNPISFISFRRRATNDSIITKHELFNAGSHFFATFVCQKPVFCFCCNDYIWGGKHMVSCCYFCKVTLHTKICSSKYREPCPNLNSNNNLRIHAFFKEFSLWSNDDVLEWLSCIRMVNILSQIKSCNLNGKDMMALSDKELQNFTNIKNKEQFRNFSDAVKYLLKRNQIRDISSMMKLKSSGSLSHSVKTCDFHAIKNCSVCKNDLFGIFSQGYICSKCKLIFHKWCFNSRHVPPCIKNNSTLDIKSTLHATRINSNNQETENSPSSNSGDRIQRAATLSKSNIRKQNSEEVDHFDYNSKTKVKLFKKMLKIVTQSKHRFNNFEKFYILWGDSDYNDFKMNIYKNVIEGQFGIIDQKLINSNISFSMALNFIFEMGISIPYDQISTSSMGILANEDATSNNTNTQQVLRDSTKIYNDFEIQEEDIIDVIKRLPEERIQYVNLIVDSFLKMRNVISPIDYAGIFVLALFIPQLNNLRNLPSLMIRYVENFNHYLKNVEQKLNAKLKSDRFSKDDDDWLEYQEFYWHKMDRKSSNNLIKKYAKNCFLVRDSVDSDGYTIVFMTDESAKSLKVTVNQTTNKFISVLDESKEFPSLTSLIHYYKDNPIFKINPNSPSSYLLYPVTTKKDHDLDYTANSLEILKSKFSSCKKLAWTLKEQEMNLAKKIKDIENDVECENLLKSMIEDVMFKANSLILENMEFFEKSNFKMEFINRNDISLTALKEDSQARIKNMRQKNISYKSELRKKIHEKNKNSEYLKNLETQIKNDSESNSKIYDESPENNWYAGDISKEAVRNRFHNAPPGTFLVRTSERDYTKNVLSIKTPNKILHYLIKNVHNCFSIIGSKKRFDALETMIEFYKNNSIETNQIILLKYPIGNVDDEALYDL